MKVRDDIEGELRERIGTLERERADTMAENTRLRAALAQSKNPCVYCSLPAEDWAKCQIGFPGCSRADDAMGCPELGASLALKDAGRDAAALRAASAETPENIERLGKILQDADNEPNADRQTVVRAFLRALHPTPTHEGGE